MAEKLRLNKYLWAIRVFKTRTQATTAIESGKVKLNGTTIKPSRIVGLGDKYEIKTPARNWIIEVTGLIENRVGYPEAIKNYIDNTPEEEREFKLSVGSSFNTGKRQSKIGRPTKKQRRDLDGFMDE